MGNNRLIKKSWRKIANEKISKEMSFGWNYVKDQMDRENRKKDLRWYKQLVKDWTMDDVEIVWGMLRQRKECNPEVFSQKFYQVIYPLLGNCRRHPDVDKVCNLLSQVVEKRMCDDSSRYGLWK